MTGRTTTGTQLGESNARSARPASWRPVWNRYQPSELTVAPTPKNAPIPSISQPIEFSGRRVASR